MFFRPVADAKIPPPITGKIGAANIIDAYMKMY